MLLGNGRPVHLRPITPADGEALRDFHHSLSDQTVYFRFFSAKPELTDRDVHYFTEVDYDSRVAIVALDSEGIVGVGRYDALGDGRAEVAFVVRDDLQGRGLGSVLLEHLAAAARERGVERFIAEVLPENHRMIATFREAGFEVRQRREEDVLAVAFDIEPTAASVAVMEAREHRAEARSVHRLLHPHRVAVVGASRRPGGLGHELLRHIVAGGYTGELVAVHPEVDEIAGVRCVRALSDVDGVIDLAVVVVPSERVPDVIDDAGAAGVLGLVVVSGGFGDSGPDGAALQGELVAAVRRTGMRLVGPNALGLVNTEPDVSLNASLVPAMPPRGRIGFFSQSGALGGPILERFRRHGLGVSTFVSAGNRADISGNDLLQYWEEDAGTDTVLLYLETIGNARKFARILARLSPRKPVVMVRAGGAGQRHPLGHEVISTRLSQRAVDQILGDCGLIIVDSIDEMLDVARIAGRQPLPRTSGVAIVSNSDALAVMAVNAMAGTPMTVVGDPVTFARQESPEAYEEAIRAARADARVGSVLAIYVPPIEHPSGVEIRATLRRCATASGPGGEGVPVVAVMLDRPAGDVSGDVLGDVPAFLDVEDALAALGPVVRYAHWRRATEREAAESAEALAASDGLAADGAGMAADDGHAPGEYAGAAAAEMLRTAGVRIRLAPDDSPRLGLRVRLIEDPLCGPVLVVGVDDPVAETLDDRSYRLAPVTTVGAARMIRGLASLRVLGIDPATDDLGALAECLARVSTLADRDPAIATADLRHVGRDVESDTHLSISAASVTVAGAAVTAEPSARRL